MAPRLTTTLVKGVPPDLKQQLIDRIDGDQLRSMNDVIVSLLAAHYGTPFESSGYRQSVQPDPNVSTIEVRLPQTLYRRIVTERMDRRLRGDRIRQADLIIGILRGQLNEVAAA